jgi:hypothetical protein
MNSVIISDYGVMLAKTGERLVIRGPKPRLELIEGGPQLFLPLGLHNKRPTLSVVTSDGLRTPPPPLRRSTLDANGAKPPKKSADEIEMPLFRVGEIVIGSPGSRFPRISSKRAANVEFDSRSSHARANLTRCFHRQC